MKMTFSEKEKESDVHMHPKKINQWAARKLKILARLAK